MTNEPEFVVTNNPPWYNDDKRTVDNDRQFTCVHTKGLLDQVARVMKEKTAEAAATCKAYQQRTVRKLVRDMVIEDIQDFKQKPSRSLLFALMDLVDIQGGALECMSTEDRAGMKQAILALNNYTLFYIPNKALKNTVDDRIVIPVVTMWDHKKTGDHRNKELELRFCDEVRSMLATYTVNLESASYFMQQVLAVPSVQSLRLLENVAGDRYQFWDMSLEVPTHEDALTPFFKQIQPAQLLRAEDKDRSSSTQDGSGGQEPGEAMEQIQPMCCVLDEESKNLQISKRQGSVDCFSAEEVICDFSRFKAGPHVTQTVYFRRMGRVLGRKRGNLIAVVSMRESQRNKAGLYVSTTARFCRAIKYSCVKGSGELLKCCHTKINELACRDTFLTGFEMHQDIIHSAVTAFGKRVSPPANNWCNYTPKHVACLIKNPIMSEIVDMGIRLMDAKIPNAFMVAELLLSAMKTVNRYLQARACYANDRKCRTEITKNNITNLDVQFNADLKPLLEIAAKIANSKGISKAHKHAIEDLFRDVNAINVNDTFKQWQHVIKDLQQQAKAAKKQTISMTKDQIKMKVIFCNLRVYLAKMNKLNKTIKTHGEEVGSSSLNTSSDSPKSKEDLNVAPVSPSEKPWYLHMIIPDNPPLGTWIRNIGALLQSLPWLYANRERREAVCNVLGLDKNAVRNKYTSVLKQWACNNSTVIEQLKSHNLDDTLSSALIKIVDDMSHGSWIRNVDMAFRRKPVPSTRKAHKHRGGKRVDADIKPKKSNKSSRRNVIEEYICQEASSGEEEWEQDTDEENEPGCKGEDLRIKEEYDKRELFGDDDDDDDEKLDEYDLEDDFIDDRSECSVVDSDQDDPPVAKPGKYARVRVVQDSDSDQNDPGQSDKKRGPAKVTERRSTKHEDAEKTLKKIKIRFDRPDKKNQSREKDKAPSVPPSDCTTKKSGKRKFKTRHSSHDRDRPGRIYSDSDSDAGCPPAKRSHRSIKQRTQKDRGSVDYTTGRGWTHSDSDSCGDRSHAERSPPKIKQRTKKKGTAVEDPTTSPVGESSADTDNASDFDVQM